MKSRVSGAPVAMHLRGELTDALVLKEITGKPGITVSEIASNLGWSNGKVDGSANRLVSKGMASVKHCLKRGALVKMVYPDKFVRRYNVVEIPREMVNDDLWQDNVFTYFLSRSTIGIANHDIKEWDEKALFKKGLKIEKNRDKIILKLPDKFSDFYQLSNSDMSLSSLNDSVMITVESILPVKLPVEYLEEPRYTFMPFGSVFKSEIKEGATPYSVSSVELTKREQKGIKLPKEPLHMIERKKPFGRKLLTRIGFSTQQAFESFIEAK